MSNRVQVFGIGARKAASGWLFLALAQHPEIVSPRNGIKELNFFNHNYNRGYSWYHGQFPDETGFGLDFSVEYLGDPCVPARLANYNGSPSLVVVLRNPVDRAFSHHRHCIAAQGDYEIPANFADAVTQNPAYLEEGRYKDKLQPYVDVFGEDAISFVLFEDLISEPWNTVKDIYVSLGLDPNPPLLLTPSVSNRPVLPRSRFVHNVRKRLGAIIKRRLSQSKQIRLRESKPVRTVRRINDVPVDSTLGPLDEGTRKDLTEFFADDICFAEHVLRRRLEHWRRVW